MFQQNILNKVKSVPDSCDTTFMNVFSDKARHIVKSVRLIFLSLSSLTYCSLMSNNDKVKVKT